MSRLDSAIRDLVIANRILANEDPNAPELVRAWEDWAVRAGCGDPLA